MTYATEHYKNSGIPYCEVCGESYTTNEYGDRICPEQIKECPLTPVQPVLIEVPPVEPKKTKA